MGKMRLREMREEHHHSKIQIADYLGISERYYKSLEDGSRMIRISQLVRLADLYQVSLDYLAGISSRREIQ